jgi:hypothetical protein
MSEWIKNMYVFYVHKIEYYSAMKRNKDLTYAAMHMNFKNTVCEKARHKAQMMHESIHMNCLK